MNNSKRPNTCFVCRHRLLGNEGFQPWLVMYPAALILFFGGHVWEAIALFLIATFLVGLVDNLLQPTLIGRDSGMPELIVFFSTVGGIGLFGVTGFIVGPLIAALFLTLLEIYGKEFSQQLAFVHNHVDPEEPVQANAMKPRPQGSNRKR